MGRTIDLNLNDEYEGRFIFDNNSRLTKMMVKKIGEPITEFQEVDTSYVGRVLKVSDLPDLIKESELLSNLIYRTDWYSKSFSNPTVKVEYEDINTFEEVLNYNPEMSNEYDPLLKECRKLRLDVFVNSECILDRDYKKGISDFTNVVISLIKGSSLINKLFDYSSKNFECYANTYETSNGIKFIHYVSEGFDNICFYRGDGIKLGFIKG